jgi:hypothetical protein
VSKSSSIITRNINLWDVVSIDDIYVYFGIPKVFEEYFSAFFKFIIDYDHIERLEELKNKGYISLLIYYLVREKKEPGFLEYTINRGKNHTNIFQHMLCYCIQKIKEQRPFEEINFIIVPESFEFSNTQTNLKFLRGSRGCPERKIDGYTFFSNSCVTILNNMENKRYEKLDADYYTMYKETRMPKASKEPGILKRLYYFKTEYPSEFYRNLYTCFNLNDLRIRIIGTEVVGLGYQMYYDTLKTLTLVLNDDILKNIANGARVSVHDFYILGGHHPYIDVGGRFIACGPLNYKTRLEQDMKLSLCKYIYEKFDKKIYKKAGMEE